MGGMESAIAALLIGSMWDGDERISFCRPARHAELCQEAWPALRCAFHLTNGFQHGASLRWLRYQPTHANCLSFWRSALGSDGFNHRVELLSLAWREAELEKWMGKEDLEVSLTEI